MADYKKKKVSKKIPDKKNTDKRNIETVKMRSKNEHVSRKSSASSGKFKVVKGRKGAKIHFASLIFGILAVILVVYFIVVSLHPIGFVEYTSAAFKTIGNGSGYDISLNYGDILDVSRNSGYYQLLTQSTVETINNNGKLISSVSHGLSNPVMLSAETRYLVYGQGDSVLKIYNFDRQIKLIQFDDQIICADITDDGKYAVAAHADGYDSQVIVFNKNHSQLYKWFSSDGIVTSVNLVDNGKKILVCAIKSSQGQISSYVHLLQFDSADPIYTFTFTNSMVYKMYSVSNNTVCAVTENSCEFINYKNGTVSSNKTELTNKLAEPTGRRLAILSTLSANTEVNNISVYKKGSLESSISIGVPVKDLALENRSVYVLSDGKVYRHNTDGSLISSAEVPFDVKYLIPVSDNSVAAVSNSGISKYQLTEKEK